MPGPTQSVRPGEEACDPSPISLNGDGEFSFICKKFTSSTRVNDESSDESDDESPIEGSTSLDSTPDGSRSPWWDLRAEPPKRRPSAITEEHDSGEDEHDGAGGQAGNFMKAAGGAAATAAAAAAAANAVAAQQRVRAPPGLVQPESSSRSTPPGLVEPELLSRGSGMHRSGDCSPCVWHWKPQGCRRGRECGYCHLCPEGEIKTRKKAKLATLRSGSHVSLEAPDEKDPSQESQAPEFPSIGSELHAVGECRPCAWFWKPQGCQNGQECRHCHLCPEGEIKLRKKQKVETIRKDQQGDDEEPPEQRDPVKIVTNDIGGESPFAVSILPPPGLSGPLAVNAPLRCEVNVVQPPYEVDAVQPPYEAGTLPIPCEANALPIPCEVPSLGSAQHGSGDCRPCAWFWKPQGCQNGRECRHCHLCPDGEIKARKKEKLGSLRQEKQPEETPRQRPEALLLSQACASPLCLPMMPPPALPSIGSSLHGTGMCRPCAWFWKPQGCENGLECCHCHLCPEGEIKARRKMKVAVLRHQGAMHEQLELQQEQMGQWEAQWEAQQHAASEFYEGHQQVQEDDDELEEDDDDDLSPLFMEDRSLLPQPVPLDLSASLDSPLPSAGSALHSLGKCRPCAWFWKPKGCLNGQACAHCHLCPDGELKVRKKVKETAMRIGALMPARRGLDARSPRIVKIAPVLGA